MRITRKISEEVIVICKICWLAEKELATWDRAYVNNLPDEAFAVIEPAYKRGDVKDRNCRHLPHHTAGVKRGLDSKDNIDMPHLRNGLARMDQITPVTNSIATDKLRQLAKEHLEKHARDLGIAGRNEKSKSNSLIASLSQDKKLSLPSGVTLNEDGSVAVKLVSQIGEMGLAGFKPGVGLLQDKLREGLTVGDIKPREEDYLRFSVRALSKVIVTQHIDFSVGDVLKNSVKLLEGVTIFPDHDKSVCSWLGSVIKTNWSEEPLPSGIDATLQIDTLANLQIARGLLNEPPAINRVSVMVAFDWEKSHDDLDDWAFIGSLGKKVDGKVVRFIATVINYYGELSLVWRGSDPYAKRKAA